MLACKNCSHLHHLHSITSTFVSDHFGVDVELKAVRVFLSRLRCSVYPYLFVLLCERLRSECESEMCRDFITLCSRSLSLASEPLIESKMLP